VVARRAGRPERADWTAKDDDGTVVGTVRLHLAAQANGRHRADVSKLLVHRGARRRGVARALLDALEAEALRRGRTLLMLDTETRSPAEELYLRCGWSRVAVVEGYLLSHRGTLDPTTFMSKQLD
jgi:acetyltransferase